MKKTILTLSILGAVLLCGVMFTTTPGCSSDGPKDDSLKGDTPKVETGIPVSYSNLPLDISAQNQAAVDTFSWQSFIALNWPGNPATCGADTTQSILTGDGPVVWETYLSSDQVFVAPGQQPASWCSNGSGNSMQHVPQKVLELGQKTGINRFIHLTSKSPAESGSNDPQGLDQASGGPLVDQNGRFARYEVRMNEDEYNYIMAETLWTKSGQTHFAAEGKQFNFPAGPGQYGSVGAMEIKAAWKVMGAGDDTTRFYCIRAIVYNDDQGDPSPGPNPVTLGLVGLHIAHKTATQGNWVWSTFEQVDNLTKSFFNPACDTCTPNQPIANQKDLVELNPNGSPAHSPTQVTRVNEVEDPFVDGINTYFQGMLDGSVWENYELISAQWLLAEDMVPSYLANSVQETYLQGPNPPSYGGYPLRIDEAYYTSPKYKPFNGTTSSSCMGCHYVAKAAGIRSDFSFILGDAQ